MSGALSNVFGGGNILGLALNMVSLAFPPLAVANSLSNLLTQAIGQAFNKAIDTLVQQFGMPKFVGEMVKNLAGETLGNQMKPSSPDVDAAVAGDPGVQDWMGKFVEDLASKIVESARQGLDSKEARGKEGKRTAGSWLQAIAMAMGSIAGDKAAQMVELSQKMADLNAAGKEIGKNDTTAQQENARAFSETQSLFQATSQEFSILQNTFANAIKSIGEGLTAMGRKG